jgi:DNA modification methylase
MTSTFVIQEGDALLHYANWPKPAVIISDGVYGTSAWPGDLDNPNGIIDWYEPHIEAWTSYAGEQTSLWLWCSEVGWATLHHILSEYDWTFRGCNVWDKGLAHAIPSEAGALAFPSVTELCVHYVRDPDKAKFNLPSATTNTWREPTVRGAERVSRAKVGQKPLRLMNLIIQASSDPEDIIWEPFAGVGSASVAAFQSGRKSYGAEINPATFEMAQARIEAVTDAEGALRRQMELFAHAQTIE